MGVIFNSHSSVETRPFVWPLLHVFFQEDFFMTTINNMSKTDSISLQFAGRDYINLVGGENKFKKNYIEKVIKDEQAANTLVDIMVRLSPCNYLYFNYKGKYGGNIEGIRFYYLINHPATTKLNIYRKSSEEPLVNNHLQKCYVIVEYKKNPKVKFLAISAIAQKNDIDTFNGMRVETSDGHHIA
jgi:hypothetical protein